MQPQFCQFSLSSTLQCQTLTLLCTLYNFYVQYKGVQCSYAHVYFVLLFSHLEHIHYLRRPCLKNHTLKDSRKKVKKCHNLYCLKDKLPCNYWHAPNCWYQWFIIMHIIPHFWPQICLLWQPSPLSLSQTPSPLYLFPWPHKNKKDS